MKTRVLAISLVVCGLALSGCQGERGTDASPVEGLARQAPAAAGPATGPALVRRLTRDEIANTLADVLGMDAVNVRETLPDDVPSAGFRNDVAGQLPSPPWVQAQAATAEAIAAGADWPAALAFLTACQEARPECEHGFVRRLGRRLYRRPLSDAEVSNLVRLFDLARDADVGFEAGARLVLQAMLQSPHFLFRAESGARPNAFERATRLAFFLWNAGPDERLLDWAEEGALLSTEGWRHAVDYALADARAARGLRAFVDDWLSLHLLERRTAPEGWPADLYAQMREETLSLFERLAFAEGRPLRDALLARTTRLTPALASLYGLAARSEPRWLEDLSSNPQRLGVLTHPAWLSLKSHGLEASLINRGVSMLRAFLCEDLPSPPDAAATQFPTIPPGTSARRRVELHSADPACAVCHGRIDPLGAPFEPYDGLGRHRHADAHGNPTSSVAELELDGKRVYIQTIAGLASALHGSATVRRCLVQKWLQFAQGRTLTEADGAQLIDLDAQAGARSHLEMMRAFAEASFFLAPAVEAAP